MGIRPLALGLQRSPPMSQSGILLLFMALAAQNQHVQAEKAETSCLADI